MFLLSFVSNIHSTSIVTYSFYCLFQPYTHAFNRLSIQPYPQLFNYMYIHSCNNNFIHLSIKFIYTTNKSDLNPSNLTLSHPVNCNQLVPRWIARIILCHLDSFIRRGCVKLEDSKRHLDDIFYRAPFRLSTGQKFSHNSSKG